MATAVKQRRGTATEHDSDKGDGSGFTGLEGEITVDTTNDTIRVHDGSQVGGHRLAKYSELSTVATAITTTDESSDTTCFPLLSTDATGNLSAKTDASSLTYNASNGTLSATTFSGALNGNVTGTIQTASQPNITSLGSLTSLTVNGTKIELTDTTTGSTTENPSLELYRNGGAGSDGHELGAIKFFGNNDAGSPEKIEYAKIYAELIDATDGTEDGSLKFHLMSNGSSEDPVMTLQQFGLIMASGNSIYLGANGTLSFEGTDETNNLETAIVATNPTADRTITLPDATGTVALTDTTNTAEFFEISSSTAPTSDNACHPVLSIYDNADRSGQSDNPSGGLNNAGALRFYFNNKAGNKTFAAGMRALAVDIADGEERAGIEFCLPTGSAGDTVTDVTASHSNIESPVMSLFKYGLVMANNNDIFLGQAEDVIQWDTGTYVQKLRGRSSESSGADSTITLPDKNGTLVANASGVISESITLMELSSTDAGAGELPVISVYRNSASPADNDEMGSIRFFGNNEAGTPEKVFYAGIYCEAPKVDASGAHKGSLRFNLADGSGGSTGITDPTADVAGDKDPVVIMTTSNLELKECDLFIHDGQNIVIDGSSNKTTLTHVEPTADRTVSLPDADGTLAHIASNGGLQHPALSSNPSSPANGQTYYNTTDHKLKLYANGAWVDLN